MSDVPCDLVIKHHEILGGIAADIAHIKKTVDNGLSKKLDDTVKELTVVQALLQKQKTDAELEFVKMESSNWLSRILTGSVSKALGVIFLVIFLNAAINIGGSLFVKEKISKEPAGQQAAILQQQNEMKIALDGAYHSHHWNGKTILHAGDANKPAWVLNPATNQWERAPGQRTEEGVK